MPKEIDWQQLFENGSPNEQSASRLMLAILPVYLNDTEICVRDALADLRHACDLLNLDFSEEDRVGYSNYSEEVYLLI